MGKDIEHEGSRDADGLKRGYDRPAKAVEIEGTCGPRGREFEPQLSRHELALNVRHEPVSIHAMQPYDVPSTRIHS